MAQTTIDHDTIRRWVEARGGCPARVKRTGTDGDPGILRIDFPGYSGQQTLERIGWDQFFEWFERNELAFIYQERTSGGRQSRFNKLVSRASVRDRSGQRGAGGSNDAGGDGASDGRSKAAAPSGDDALGLLIAQHRQVEEMMTSLTDQQPQSMEFRRQLTALADALELHTALEEQLFYPAVKRAETAALLKHSVEEHLQVKRVLATIIQCTPGTDLHAELDELAGLTEEHVIEEEHELFPLVRKALPPAELIALRQKLEELTARLQAQGCPGGHLSEQLEAPAGI